MIFYNVFNKTDYALDVFCLYYSDIVKRILNTVMCSLLPWFKTNLDLRMNTLVNHMSYKLSIQTLKFAMNVFFDINMHVLLEQL